MGKKAVLGQLLKRLPKAVGTPPEPPAYFDGAEIEDDLSGIIDAEQDSYTVQSTVPSQDFLNEAIRAAEDVVNTETGEIADNQESIDAERQQYEAERAAAGAGAPPRPRRQRAQPASAPEPRVEPPWESFGGTQPPMQEPVTEDDSPF